jgi:O-methyltransferase/8-demethyl-8-(2,3-dimethoxy-alpha-L-rhamnosyl)tetracenomycin-C 4'-O-methyltransferase
MTKLLQSSLRDAYLDVVKRTITNYPYLGGSSSPADFAVVKHYDLENARWRIDPLSRPMTLLTRAQLDLIEEIVDTVHDLKVPGDLLEAGVWRGGAVAFMRAVLHAYQVSGRRVFAADSFAGIPQNTRALGDPVDQWTDRWAASLDEVRGNLNRLGLLDERIVFVPGYFEDTLASLKNERFALIRLDSDSYDSVMTSLERLYPLLSKSGFVVVDDWHLGGCRKAVEDYRARHRIQGEVQVAHGNAFWAKYEEYKHPPLP